MSRFLGTQGTQDLVRYVAEQKLFSGCPSAAALVDPSDVQEYPEGKQIYVEGEPYRPVIYLILSGRVELKRAGKFVANMERGDFFGEFPLLDALSHYTVSATVCESAAVASLSWHAFEAWAEGEPKAWANMARELALRLRRSPSSGAKSQENSPKGMLDAVVQGIYLTFRELPLSWRIAVAALAVLVALTAGGFAWVWAHLPDSSRTHVLRELDLVPAQAAASITKP